MVFICYVTLQDQRIKVLNGFMVRGLSRYVTILSTLVVIGTVIMVI